jgi:uncharacterized protein (TIGR03083 family)
MDYLTHLQRDSERFLEALGEAEGAAHVPTCPDWSADDLLWHLGEVQWFWATVVDTAVADPSELQHPERPADRAGLISFFVSASQDLQRALAGTDPAATRWTWSDEQTAGFIRRRQAHEALIHRVDAELTAGVDRAAMDPELCTDGVDEALRVIWAGTPDWGRTRPEAGATLRIAASDTGSFWLVTLGRFTGTDPDGVVHDEPDILVAPGDAEGSDEPTAATVTGRAADLDCWLWGRPTTSALDRSGDRMVLSRFDAIIGQGID